MCSCWTQHVNVKKKKAGKTKDIAQNNAWDIWVRAGLDWGVWVEGYGIGDGGGDIVCVCPYCSVVKNAFVVLKVRWAPLLLLLLLLLFFFPSSILPHTFEHLCGIVPWSWLGSLLPRPGLPPGQLAHAPRSDTASRGMAQRQGLQKAPKPGELVPPKAWGSLNCCCHSLGQGGWGVRLVNVASQQMDVDRCLCALCMWETGRSAYVLCFP